MRKILFLIITIATVLFFVACEKEKVPTQKIQKPFEEGVYTGTFTVKYFVEMPESWIQTLTSEALLEFKDGKFTCTHSNMRGGGSGYHTISDSTIIFDDTNGWFADFDWNLILTGEYNFNFDGTRLIISANKNEVGFYKYDLIKQ